MPTQTSASIAARGPATGTVPVHVRGELRRRPAGSAAGLGAQGGAGRRRGGLRLALGALLTGLSFPVGYFDFRLPSAAF